MINPQWLELPMCRTDFHGPKAVRAIEVPDKRGKENLASHTLSVKLHHTHTHATTRVQY